MNVTLGSWITIGHPVVAELMASKGFDWLTIDMEHTSMDYGDIFKLVQTISLKGMKVFVRVGENDANLIKRVMDTGADGVIVPMVNSKEDAIKAVESVKYPPLGKRGVGLSRAQGYGYKFEEYKEWLEKESTVIAQIEHIDAVNNLDEILSVDGIDGTIVGPYDLSGSLGIPGKFDDQKVIEALDRYEKISKKMGVPMGFHIVDPNSELVNKYIKKGYEFIAVGLDTLFLGHKIEEVLDEIRK